MVKEAAPYMRGFSLGILLFGFVRIALDDAVSGTSGTTTVSIVASLAIQSMTICMIRTFYRRED